MSANGVDERCQPALELADPVVVKRQRGLAQRSRHTRRIEMLSWHFECYAAKLARDHVIRYEDLVTNPNQMLKGIQNFLGLEGNVADDDLRPGLNETYFAEWKKGGPLTALRNRRTVSRYESRINKLGYSFSSPMPVGPLPENFPTL